VPQRFQNVQQNFSAGELTPRLSARVDIRAYENALKQSKNFIVSSQGGAMFREGMQYIGVPPSNQPFRTFQFHRGGDRSDILIEVSEGIIRYWVDDRDTGIPYLWVDLVTILHDEDDLELLHDEDDGELLSVGVVISDNPYSLEDLDSLYFTNQDKFGILCHTRHPPRYITVERDGTIVAQELPLYAIPLFKYNDTKTPGYSSTSGKWTITFPESWETQSYIYYVTYNGIHATTAEGMIQSYIFDPTPGGANAGNIQTGLINAALRAGLTTGFAVTEIGGDVRSYDVVVSGADSGFDVAVHAGQFVYGHRAAGFIGDLGQLPQFNIITQSNRSGSAVEEPAWSYPTMVYHDGAVPTEFRYYQCIQVHTSATGVNEPGSAGDWTPFWVDLGIALPDGFEYQYPGGNLWANGEVYAPRDRGFPTVCLFNDQRLLLMANKDNPTAIYGSAIGGFQAFTPGPNDDEPYLYVLDSSDTPQIKWGRSLGNLTLGTSGGEWRITSEGTITPTQIHAEQQNNARSHLNMPVQVDTEIFYIEQGERKLRVTRYTRETLSFQTTDISVLAEHLISADGIKRLVSSYIPEVFMTMVRNNGQPVFLSYEKGEAPVAAFTNGETDGFVYDCAAYFSLPANKDYTYYSTFRNNNYTLERMNYPSGKIVSNLTAQKVVHLDGWVSGTVSGSTISGLWHLEGRPVNVLLDDAWQIGEYVVDAGIVQLDGDHTGKLYAVGLPYEGILQTFEATANSGSADNLGTGLGTKRRWNKLYTRLLNSALPKIHTDRDSDRLPATLMGVGENVRAGLQDIHQTTSGYGDGSITVLMDRPYPVHVIGFFGEYQVEDR
jgi:hypothetical protein